MTNKANLRYMLESPSPTVAGNPSPGQPALLFLVVSHPESRNGKLKTNNWELIQKQT